MNAADASPRRRWGDRLPSATYDEGADVVHLYTDDPYDPDERVFIAAALTPGEATELADTLEQGGPTALCGGAGHPLTDRERAAAAASLRAMVKIAASYGTAGPDL